MRALWIMASVITCCLAILAIRDDSVAYGLAAVIIGAAGLIPAYRSGRADRKRIGK